MNRNTKHLKTAGALIFAVLPAIAFPADPYPPVKFNIPEAPGFVESLGLDPARHEGPQGAEEKKAALTGIFSEKSDQHAMSRHYEKGLGCTSCHDQQKAGAPDWMLAVTKPAMKTDCGDCHTTQKGVFAKTDTHAKIDCVACHMPNMTEKPAAEDGMNYEAVRRAHVYRISTAEGAETYKKTAEGWEYALDDKLHPYVDLMWACGRATPADYTLSGEGQGCHSPRTSTLDEGLRYATLGAVYEETVKWQAPVREGWKLVKAGLERQRLLLDATNLKPADRTEVHLMLDKAQEVADEVEADGSWGVHAPRYLKERVETAQGYIEKAQSILDAGGFTRK